MGQLPRAKRHKKNQPAAPRLKKPFKKRALLDNDDVL